MNVKGGRYCIARYGGGMYGMSKVDSLMLKFRPIAPKPVAAGSGSGGSATGSGDEYVKCGRSKRKYVRVNKSRKKKDGFKRRGVGKVKESFDNNNNNHNMKKPVVTLSLLTETPDQKVKEPVSGFSDQVSGRQTKKASQVPVWLSFGEPAPALRVRPGVVSNVTVECVTDTWVDSEGLGCTDEEIVKNMEMDTCPGFISDGQDRVVWTNKAYRQMAGVGHVAEGDDVAVVLVRKDKTTPSPAFTCKVRVSSRPNSTQMQQTPSPSSPTLTLPCDVWRMERGACAWRLDVKAALSLGR